MATSATSGPKLSSRSSSKREKNSSEETKQKSQRQTDNHNLKEIADAQFELEKMRSEKKRGMKAKQLNRYATAMYGTPQEKEELRREQRECLLTQIRQKEECSKITLKEKVKESETAVAFDKECLDKDRHEQMKKASYLTQFRDGNKQLIEIRAEQRRKQKEHENYQERELLKQNPLNWSNTLS